MLCWHVGPCGVGCDGYIPPGQAREVMPPAQWIPDPVNAWKGIAEKLEAQLAVSMEQTNIAQENCRKAQEACEQALTLLREHLKVCTSR